MYRIMRGVVGIVLFCFGFSTVIAQEAKPRKLHYDVPGGIEESHVTGRMRIFPDPNKPQDLFSLIKTYQPVQAELALSEQVTDAVGKFLEDERNYVNDNARRGNIPEIVRTLNVRNQEAIAELLTPEDLARLRELAYRFEVSVFGLADALIEGRLGEYAGIYENQHEMISRKGKEIENKAREKILAILMEAEEELLQELAPQQRNLAKKAMGNYFLFPNVDSAKELRKKLVQQREKRLAAEAQAPPR